MLSSVRFFSLQVALMAHGFVADEEVREQHSPFASAAFPLTVGP